MQVIIDEIVSSVRAVDSQALLSREVMDAIVKAVVAAVEQGEQHRKRLDDEVRFDSSSRPAGER